MSVGQESVVCPVLDDSVQLLCISHLEIDRYQRLARREAGSGVESFLSASFELTIVSSVRAAFRISPVINPGEPSRFRRCPNGPVGKDADCNAAATAFRVAVLFLGSLLVFTDRDRVRRMGA